jgi:hypothetical protein
MPTEDWVGLGLGVSLLVVVAVVGRVFYRPPNRNLNHPLQKADDDYDQDYGYDQKAVSHRLPSTLRRWVLIAPWLALLAYCMKSGMVTGARLISPYYPLLLPLLILGAGQAAIVRTRWWRVLVWIVLCAAFPVVILVPGRPLWPARTMLAKLSSLKPGNHSISRALEVYAVYARRADPMAEVRALLPEGLAVVGFLGTPDDIDISFWRPLGRNRVKHLLVSDSATDIRQRGIQYAVVSQFCLAERSLTLEEWRARAGAELLVSTSITQKVAEGAKTWHVVRFP